MAFYIEMDRTAETEEYVEYTFGRGGGGGFDKAG